MAKPDAYAIHGRDAADLADLLRWWRTETEPAEPETRRRGRGHAIEMALADGTISPGATATAKCADEDWIAVPGKTLAVKNDSGKTIPNNTRLFVIRKKRHWRIIQALICAD